MDNQLNSLLRASIAVEQNRKIKESSAMMVQSAEDFIADQEAAQKLLIELSAIKKQMDRVNAQNTIMAGFILKQLDSIEANFDNDEKFTSPEHAQDYLDAAKWMSDNYGRKDYGRIDRVQTWLDNYLPY